MPESTDAFFPLGPTAFVLAGGGTKGSFEVGVLQYLVGVEQITPEIITATSAGAIAATVLAQARTLEEFSARVDEIEDDVLAWTHTDTSSASRRGSARSTARPSAARSITSSPRAPGPRSRSTPRPCWPRARVRRHPRRRGVTNAGGRSGRVASANATCCALSPAPACGCPGSAAASAPAAARSSTSSPLADALRNGSSQGVRAVDPTLVGRPGLQLRLAVTALRAGVAALRHRGRHDRPGGRPHPGARRSGRTGRPPRRRHRVGERADDLPAPPHGGRRLRRRRRRRDHPGACRRRSSGATRIIAVVAVPLAVPRDERDYATAPAGYIGLRSMGMIGVAERQISNLGIPLPAGSTLTVIDPVVDVVGLFEVEPGLLRINKDYGWLRAADVLAEGDPDLLADVAADTHAHRGPARGLAPGRVAVGRRAPIGDDDEPGTLALVREHKERVRTTWSTGASSSASRCPTAARTGGPVRGPRRRASDSVAKPASRPAAEPQTVGPPEPAPPPEVRHQEHDGRHRRGRCRGPRRSTSARCQTRTR